MGGGGEGGGEGGGRRVFVFERGKKSSKNPPGSVRQAPVDDGNLVVDDLADGTGEEECWLRFRV